MRNACARRVKIDVVVAGERFDPCVLRQIFRRSILDVVIDGEHWLRRISNAGCTDLFEFGITAPVLSCVITWRGRIEMKSPLRTTVPGASPSAWRAAIFSTSVSPISGGNK